MPFRTRMLACLLALTVALASCASVPDAPPATSPSQAALSASQQPGSFEIPILTPLENGNIVVRFKKTGCSVLFDRDGKLLEGGRHCDDVDIHRARQAVKAHIAERDADFLGV